MGYHYSTFSYNCVIFVLFTVSAFIWFYQIQRRLIQPEVRKNLTICVIMMVFWMFLRTIKYDFLPKGHITERYAWYLYYVPQTLCILLIFLSVLHIGRPQNRPISPFWKLLYIPSLIIILGILTNDFHQLAFYFPNGMASCDNDNYIHGPFYYAAILWIGVLFAAILVTVFVKCAVPKNRRKIWLPSIPLIFGAVYCLSYLLNPDSLFVTAITMPELVCVLFVSFTECLISVHLIPSNDNYGDFWNSSTIGAGIMDKKGVVKYKSMNCIPVTEEQVHKAVKSGVLLNQGDVLLKSHEIHGGFGYWTKDISEINHLNRELEELGDVLAEENAMLDAENKLAEERIRINQQNKLYDEIAKNVSPQLDILSKLVDSPPESEEAFEQTMKYACILNSYIKRLSNMLLIYHQSNCIFSDELCLAISESLEYVKMCGIKAHFEYSGKSQPAGKCILTAYKVFESVLESGIPGADAVLVNLEISSRHIDLSIEMNAPKKSLPQDLFAEEIETLGGTIETETEQHTKYVHLVLPLGGENL
ncbi:MAG: histidine kinase N-terminal 7TM domain-containing protein [Ruminococcus sp.]